MGEERTTDGGGGEPFFPPALSCDSRACGGSCTVCVSPRPGRPVEDRSAGSDGHTEASLELLGVRAEGVHAGLFSSFFLTCCWRLRSPGREGSIAAHPPPLPSQLGNMEGVVGGRVCRDLGLEPVDVAAVAEKVAFQRITAVSLLVV